MPVYKLKYVDKCVAESKEEAADLFVKAIEANGVREMVIEQGKIKKTKKETF